MKAFATTHRGNADSAAKLKWLMRPCSCKYDAPINACKKCAWVEVDKMHKMPSRQGELGS